LHPLRHDDQSARILTVVSFFEACHAEFTKRLYTGFHLLHMQPICMAAARSAGIDPIDARRFSLYMK